MVWETILPISVTTLISVIQKGGFKMAAFGPQSSKRVFTRPLHISVYIFIKLHSLFWDVWFARKGKALTEGGVGRYPRVK